MSEEDEHGGEFPLELNFLTHFVDMFYIAFNMTAADAREYAKKSLTPINNKG